MSASLNKVMLIGNLGAKPELKYLPSGQSVCEMRIATNESYKDKEGKKQDKTEWHRVKVWGKTGENCAQYLDKGRSVYLEGRIETRSWDDKTSGEKRYATEIVASVVQFLGSDKGGKRGASADDDTFDPPSGPTAPGGSREGSTPLSDDDIPF